MKFTTKLDSDYRRLNKLSSLGVGIDDRSKGFVSVMSTQHKDTLNVISTHCYIKINNYSKQENNSIMKEQNTDFDFGFRGVPELDKLFDIKNYVATKEITRKHIKAMLSDLKELKSTPQNSLYMYMDMKTYKFSYKENGVTNFITFEAKLLTAVLKLLDRIMLDNKLDSLEFDFMPTTGRNSLEPMLIKVSSDMKIVLAPVRPL